MDRYRWYPPGKFDLTPAGGDERVVIIPEFTGRAPGSTGGLGREDADLLKWSAWYAGDSETVVANVNPSPPL